MKEDIKVAKDTRGTNVWVLAELEEGKLMNVTFELLGKAKEMAAKIDEKVAAVLVCGEVGDMPAQLIAAGADIVYTVAGPEYADYTTDLYTDAVCQLNDKFAPRALMIAATVDGRDLAPRIAARLKTGLCADCTEVDMDEEGVVAWTRPALGGNIYASIVGNEKLPQMGTVRPKVFEAAAADASRTGEVVPFVVEGEHVSRVEIVSKTPLSTGNSIKIEDAEVLVSGGRGIGDASKLEMLEELASLFENSAVSGSRAVVDEGWLPHSKQVGQSGKTVKPKLYIACGISGAVQHLAGMKESGCIVAINKDEMAPIFSYASFGVVGDLNQILPKLIKKIKDYKA